MPGSWRVVTKSSEEPEAWVDGVRSGSRSRSRSLGLFDRYGFVCSEIAGEAEEGGGLGCWCMLSRPYCVVWECKGRLAGMVTYAMRMGA